MGRGGAEKIAVQLALRQTKDSGIAWLLGESAWESELARIPVQSPLRIRGLIGLPHAISHLAALIRREKPDILHSHLAHANVAARWAARLAGYSGRIVSTEHNLGFHGNSSRLLMRLDARTSARCDAVVAISQAVRRHRERAGWPPDRIRVIYNGVSIPQHASAPDFGRIVTLGMVGRLHAEKGPDLFVEVVEELDSVRGILLTHGLDRLGFERSVHASPARDRIQIDRESTADDLIRSVDIALVPSRLEGLGLAALEAM